MSMYKNNSKNTLGLYSWLENQFSKLATRSYLSLITGICISIPFLWRYFLTKQKQQHYTVGRRSKTTLSFLCLQIFHELLLLLEDVLQFSQQIVVFCHGALTLINLNKDTGLVVGVGSESLGLFSWNSGVTLDQGGHHAAGRFDAH